jgi:hypothetical protein
LVLDIIGIETAAASVSTARPHHSLTHAAPDGVASNVPVNVPPFNGPVYMVVPNVPLVSNSVADASHGTPSAESKVTAPIAALFMLADVTTPRISDFFVMTVPP